MTKPQFWKITWFDGNTSLWSLAEWTAIAMERLQKTSTRINSIELVEG